MGQIKKCTETLGAPTHVHRHYAVAFGAALALQKLTRPPKVFELGCHDGTNCAYIRKLRPDGQFYGLDNDQKALDKAFRRGWGTWMAGTIEHWVSDPPEVDLIVCAWILYHTPHVRTRLIRAISAATDRIVIWENEAQCGINWAEAFSGYGFQDIHSEVFAMDGTNQNLRVLVR